MPAIRFLPLVLAVMLCGCAAPRLRELGGGQGVPAYTASEIAKAKALTPDEAKQEVLAGVKQRQKVRSAVE